MLTDELLAGYGRYRRNIAGNQRKLERLAREGQSPTTLWVGCSDSRVIPEQITDADPGDLFVMRNIANFVPPYGRDDAVGAVIEFAVLQLGVKQIIVCGHSGCGGIVAMESTLDEQREPHLARWIAQAGERLPRLPADMPEEQRLFETVKANVLAQRDNLLTYPFVRQGVDEKRLKLFGCVYQIETGEVIAYVDGVAEWRPLPYHDD